MNDSLALIGRARPKCACGPPPGAGHWAGMPDPQKRRRILQEVIGALFDPDWKRPFPAQRLPAGWWR